MTKRTYNSPQTPIRVGFVMQTLTQGGLEELVIRLAQGLHAQGHKPTIVALEEGPLRQRIEALDIPLRCLHKRPGLEGRLWWRLYRLARKDFDVIHTHHFGPLFYASPGAKSARIPLLHTMHSNEHLQDGKRHHHWMMRCGLQASNAITTVHEWLKDDLLLRWPSLTPKIHVLANGVDTTLFHGQHKVDALRASLSIPQDAKIVGCVARLSAEKGQDRLLHAVANMQRHPHIVFVGAGEEEAGLRALARQLGIEARVHWLGTRYDTPELLSLFDVFALASLREGLPLAALEAMASRLPLVTTDVGGLPDLLNNSKGGIFIPQHDVDAFASALDALLANPAQRESYASAGRKWVCEHASSQTMFQQYLALYQALNKRKEAT